MGFRTLAEERYSVRKFSDQPIGDEKLEMILQAGRLAPTATNAQPQKIYVLKSEEALKKIRSLTQMTFNAPIVVLIGHDEDKSWKATKYNDDFDAGVMDASIVATHMMMEAADLGIGSLWARAFNAKEVEEAFNLPKNVKIDLIMDFGYPAEDSKPNPRHSERVDLTETVKYL